MLQKQLFDIKFTAKQLSREASKAEKREADQKAKTAEAIRKGDMERAKICAENAIREKNQSLSLLRLSSRMDAVASRVEQALVMNRITKSMSGVVDGMELAFASMDPTKIAKVMEKFEQQFTEVDVKTGVMTGELERTMGSTIASEDVQNLLQQTADEHGLQLTQAVPAAPSKALASKDTQLSLEERLKNLS